LIWDLPTTAVTSVAASLVNRIQSVLNAAALSTVVLRRSIHITNTVASFYWQRSPEWANHVNLAITVYRALHGHADRNTVIHGITIDTFSTVLRRVHCRRSVKKSSLVIISNNWNVKIWNENTGPFNDLAKHYLIWRRHQMHRHNRKYTGVSQNCTLCSSTSLQKEYAYEQTLALAYLWIFVGWKPIM